MEIENSDLADKLIIASVSRRMANHPWKRRDQVMSTI